MRDEYDFSNAKRAHEVPHLVQLHAEQSGKSRVTMRIDNNILAFFKARAKASGASYQTIMNDALKQFTQAQELHP